MEYCFILHVALLYSFIHAFSVHLSCCLWLLCHLYQNGVYYNCTFYCGLLGAGSWAWWDDMKNESCLMCAPDVLDFWEWWEFRATAWTKHKWTCLFFTLGSAISLMLPLCVVSITVQHCFHQAYTRLLSCIFKISVSGHVQKKCVDGQLELISTEKLSFRMLWLLPKMFSEPHWWFHYIGLAFFAVDMFLVMLFYYSCKNTL